MNPLNHKERKKAFGNFLLIFIITVVVIVATVLFSVQAPFKQNEQLISERDKVEKEREFDASFAGIMDTTISGLKAIVSAENKNNTDQIDGQVGLKLIEMQNMITNEKNIGNKELYTKILSALYDLKASRKDNLRLSDLETMVKEYKEQMKTAGMVPQYQQPAAYPQK